MSTEPRKISNFHHPMCAVCAYTFILYFFIRKNLHNKLHSKCFMLAQEHCIRDFSSLQSIFVSKTPKKKKKKVEIFRHSVKTVY
jgi:hypothetical protein